MLACFFMMSCGSVRMVAWWMLASAPILSTHLVWLAPKLMPGPADDDEPSFAVSGFFTLFALAVIFSLPGLDRFNPLLGPTRRGQRLETDLQNIQCRLASTAAPGNIYSHFEWGEFLSWAAPPRHKIFMDGRIEIYPDEVWRKYTLVTTGGDGWDQILGEFDVNYLILDASYHRRSGLWDRVNASPQWRPEFQSGSAVLFIRQPNATPGPQVQD
jgi:hypothetical protein